MNSYINFNYLLQDSLMNLVINDYFIINKLSFKFIINIYLFFILHNLIICLIRFKNPTIKSNGIMYFL